MSGVLNLLLALAGYKMGPKIFTKISLPIYQMYRPQQHYHASKLKKQTIVSLKNAQILILFFNGWYMGQNMWTNIRTW